MRSAWKDPVLLALTCTVVAAPALGADNRAGPNFLCPEGMVAIPGGSFEFDGKKVTVKDFCLDEHEVTAGDYTACVNDGMCSEKGLADEPAATFGDRLFREHPINAVTFRQASKYCLVQGRRLPTALEWQWAARGGQAGNEYPWGNEPPGKQLCWNGPGRDIPNGRFGTCEVSEHPGDRTPQGVQGMAGNVGEWTSTPAPESSKLVCGGDFSSKKPKDVSARACYPGSPKEGSFLTGIRCATVVPGV